MLTGVGVRGLKVGASRAEGGSTVASRVVVGLSLTWLLVVNGAAASAQRPPGDRAGVLIEAEDFSARHPDDGSFAVARFVPGASSGQALLRFFTSGGWCEYDLNVPAEATYHVWLRYAARGRPRIGVGVDVDGPQGLKPVQLEPSGGLDGQWRWQRLTTVRLKAGPHRLVLGAAAVRPDCLFVTRSSAAPGDDVVVRRVRVPDDPEVRAKLARPIEPVSPDWLRQEVHYQLPAWYDGIRVCVHTRLSPRYMDKPIFLQAAAAFRSLGFREMARHVKTGEEGAWWPSAVGAVLPSARQRNWAKQIIDNAHRQGLRIIVYYRHMEDRWAAEQHPDWLCRRPDGRPARASRGNYTCFNSPYADFVLKRLLELVDMGADGFYFDEAHMPRTGCWCSYCRHKFTEQTGLSHPRRVDPYDPVWRKLIDFNNATIERTFLKWRRALHARNPNVVLLVSVNTYPALNRRHLTHRLLRIADSVKTEFSLAARVGNNRIFQTDAGLKPPEPDVRMTLGWDICRDGADGRPPHVWTHGLLDSDSARFATAGMLTHGCVANLDHPENEIPNPDKFAAAVQLGNRVAPYFAGTRPLRWAAIHFSELARDHYLPDEAEAWRKVLYPVYGAYLALLRQRLPVGFVNDSQLEEGRLSGYRVLFLPSTEFLTPGMRRAVERFRRAGGVVVEQKDAWGWHDPNGGQEEAVRAFLKTLAERTEPAPVQVFGGPEKLHAVAFAGQPNRVTVSLANDFSWVWTGRLDKLPKDKQREVRSRRPPPPCRGVRVVLRGAGRPRKVFDAVSGRPLDFTFDGKTTTVRVPEFDCLAVVVAEF